MVRIHILDNPGRWTHGGLSAFWYPLYLNRRFLREIGLTFQFFREISGRIHDCDVLFLSSRYFHIEGQSPEDKQRILKTVEALNAKINQIVWFDLRDSSGNTQFEVIPYVSKYLKKQLLVDRTEYQRQFYGNRVYTDYFHKRFGVTDTYEEESAPLPAGAEGKLGLSWNIGMLDNRGGGFTKKIACCLRDGIEAYFGLSHWLPHRSPRAHRDINLVALFHVDYKRATVAFQRRKALEILGKLNKPAVMIGGRLPRAQFLRTIARSKIVLSLFGWGEICFRDFETFLAGAALLMPDMSHLETWPQFYTAGETYWPIRWDLSDLIESYHYLLSHDNDRLDLAICGQERYLATWTEEGRRVFCERLGNIVREVCGSADPVAES